jgi:hypothetical protein
MGTRLLVAAMILVYGPLVLMAALYLVALVLRVAGRGGFLSYLIERTKVPQALKRDHVDGLM